MPEPNLRAELMRVLCHVLLKDEPIEHVRLERKLPALSAWRKHPNRFTCVRNGIRRYLKEMSEIPRCWQKVQHFLLAGKELAASYRGADRSLLVEDKDGCSLLCRGDCCLQSGWASSRDDDIETL
jgi:hypothetical protein